MTYRLLAFLWAILLPLAGLCNTITFYPDKTSAIAGCQDEGNIPGQACQPGGYAVVRWCNLNNGCTGTMTAPGTLGCAVVIQSYPASQPGGSCGYSPQTEYHYHAYPSSSCPAGTIFVGPTGSDCVAPAVATNATDAQKQYGSGITSSSTQPGDLAGICPTPSRNGTPVVQNGLRGNPCDASTGNKLHIEEDFAGADAIPGFSRTYNSFLQDDIGLGRGWFHPYAKRVVAVSTTAVDYVAPSAARTRFNLVNGQWGGDADLRVKLTVANGFFTFSYPDGSQEQFNPKGLPIADIDPAGRSTTYGFSTDGTLLTVTGPFGHKLTFAWYGTAITKVTFPDGNYVSFTRDALLNLTVATKADGSVKKYLYENSSLPHALTGITDELNTRFSTYAYDSGTGRALSTEHTGATGKFSFAYSGNQTVVTDAIGNTETLTFQRNLGVNLLVSRLSQADGKSFSQTFDAQSNLVSRTDEEGRITNFTWDGQHRLTSQTEAAGTGIERTTTYAYASPDLDLPTTVTEPGRTTTIAYTGNLPSAITVSDGASSRSIALTYTTKGQVATISGPRVDVSDTRTLEYWDCTTGAQCGQLKKLTNALGHVTTFDQYDGAGRLLKMTSPNGLATTLAYNKAGNVTTVTETPPAGAGSARSTSFTYDNAQQLKTASLPDGVVLTYAYDAAHRLTSVTDNAGNKVAYTYDLKDNRTQTVVKDSAGTIRRQVDYAFNARNFLTNVNAGGSATQMVLDAVGNTTGITDPNGHATSYAYDSLNRITSVVDRLQGTTGTGYDTAGHLARLTAPNGANWAFTTDGLGNQSDESSPDRGQLQRTFDAAGNVLSSTDARGVTASFTYDALNRLTGISYPTPGENISYGYDSCANGIGRLCSVTDSTGTRAYAYDGLGRIASVTWTANGQAYTTSYTWTPADKLASIIYPSGRVVSYTRNTLGQISAIATGRQNIVAGRMYRADGLLSGQTYGNGLVDTRAYDLQGRLTSWATGTIDNRSYSYDANGNVTAINADTFGYDWLDRITGRNSVLNFTWDANGNRQADGSGLYGYAANSNRMTSNPSGAVTLDAAGNTLSASGLDFEFNQAGRLAAARSNGALLGQYAYSFDGHRAQKTVQGATTLFHYGADDNLLAETDAAGATLKEYVWDDESRPLAQITGGVVTYLHPDYLGSPRIGTDSAKNVVWQWQDLPFGIAAPTGSVAVALRYPGQYHEAETGLFQNWNRTYDKTSGRYLESDHVGVFAGGNTFGYVDANPLRRSDPSGRCWFLGPLCYYAIVYAEPILASLVIGAEVLADVSNPVSAVASAPIRIGSAGIQAAQQCKAVAYSVAFETRISKLGIGTRSSHFRQANTNLSSMMSSDPRFAENMKKLGISVPERLDRSPANWTWHHVIDQPGVLQLVPRQQHQGSMWQQLLHPNQTGGHNVWGSEY